MRLALWLCLLAPIRDGRLAAGMPGFKALLTERDSRDGSSATSCAASASTGGR
jgi:hypothetical protein